MRVFSNADCGDTAHTLGYLKTYATSVGLTSSFIRFYTPSEELDNDRLEPTGRGYIANRNKVVGAVRRGVRRGGGLG